MKLQPGLSRRQYDIGDARQILKPEQLEAGMHIGAVAIHCIAPMQRLKRSAFAIHHVLSDRHNGVKAVQAPWHVKSPENYVLTPEWHGELIEVENGCAFINLWGIREAHTPFSVKTFDELPLEHDEILRRDFADMGIASVAGQPRSARETYHLAPQYQRRPWLPFATIDLS